MKSTLLSDLENIIKLK